MSLYRVIVHYYCHSLILIAKAIKSIPIANKANTNQCGYRKCETLARVSTAIENVKLLFESVRL